MSGIFFTIYRDCKFKFIASVNTGSLIYLTYTHISQFFLIRTGHNILFRICGNCSHSLGDMGCESLCLFFAHNIKLSVFKPFNDCFLPMFQNDAPICIGVFICACAISRYQFIRSFIYLAFDDYSEIKVFLQIITRSVHNLFLNREICQFRIVHGVV